MVSKVNGLTRTCGLIANPIEHTMSPLIHNTLAQLTDTNLVYVPFLVETDLAAAVKGAYALNVLGMNVTVPYKSEVMRHCLEVDELAEQIGAVNTLVRIPGGYKGYNTDMPGLHRALMRENVKLDGERVILIGAGGAARAVAMMCAAYGAAEIMIFNRTAERAEQIAEEINGRVGRELVKTGLLEQAGNWIQQERVQGSEKFLAIQCTNVGMYPNCDAAAIESTLFYEGIHTGYDLIYRPGHTKFMQFVEMAGGRAYNGLTMLLYQGVIAYELWNETEITQEQEKVVYQKLLESLEAAR